MKKIRVLIADDQTLFARSLRTVLQGHSGGAIEVVGIACDGREAVLMAEETEPDVILMDVRMPEMSGVEATKEILSNRPNTRIVILTTFDDDYFVFHGIKNGALGYLLKTVEPEELVAAVKTIHDSGQLMLSPSVGLRLVDYLRTGSEGGGTGTVESPTLEALTSAFPELSKREAEVLFMMYGKRDNKEIAAALYIGEQTVRNYVSRVYEKLGVSNRLHAIQRAEAVLNRLP